MTDELLGTMLEAERQGLVRRKPPGGDPEMVTWVLTEKGRLRADAGEGGNG